MKKNLFLVILLAMAIPSFSQDVNQIFEKSRAKCQSITHGYYEMTTHKKYMSGPDTTLYASNCYFKKHQEDLPFPVYFHARYSYKGEYGYDALFTDKELVSFSTKDSTGTITSLDPWKEYIENISHNYDFYDLFTTTSSYPLPDDSTYLDTTYRAILRGVEKVRNWNCYHIESHELPNSEDSPLKVLDSEYHFWINKEDMVPVQISSTISIVMGKDTMVQYDLLTLDKYELNTPFEEKKISMEAIPPYIRLKEYTPYKTPEPLPLDTIAPAWSFPSLTDEVLSLESLKGKLVLIDFFYKSCFPCMQALPALQSLHEKYKDKGLVVVGLDPYDDKEDNLASFLAKRDVDYTILYASKDIAKTYRVSGYPTIFLISKDGRILYVQVGYGEGVEAKLEEIIARNL